MKVYIVIDACSGEDYSADDPTVLFVSTNKKEAMQFFKNEIADWEEDLEDFDSNVDSGIDLIYECTDFEGDSHRVIKLVEKEIK